MAAGDCRDIRLEFTILWVSHKAKNCHNDRKRRKNNVSLILSLSSSAISSEQESFHHILEKLFEKPAERYKVDITKGQAEDYVFQLMLRIYSFT